MLDAAHEELVWKFRLGGKHACGGENMYVVNRRQEEKNLLAFYLSLVSSPETRKEHVKNWERT